MTFLKSSLLTITLLGFTSIAHSTETEAKNNHKLQVTPNPLSCMPHPYCLEQQVQSKKQESSILTLLNINKLIDLLKL